MAITQIEPYYDVGTATFAASTAVTGQGTSWLTNVEPGDQIFNRLGQMAVVQSVNSDTSITLTKAFAGTAQTAQAYTIYRVPDSVRLENFSQRSVNLLKGGNVMAEAAIDGTGGNWLSYFTGPGAKARTPLTPFARTLLDDANAAAARGTLDVAQQQSSATDTTAGRGLIVGAFGLGDTAMPDVTDPNTVSENGLFQISEIAGASNVPVARRFNGIHWQRSSDRASQLLAAVDSGFTEPRLFTRVNNGSWRDYREIYHQGSILGTVSQSGGVPTGAIIETGSNANGMFMRFADGTQICLINDVTFTRASNSIVSASITYPASFLNSPFPPVASVTRPATGGNYTGDLTVTSVGSVGSSGGANESTTLYFFRIDGASVWSSGSVTGCRVVFVGRWF